MLLFFDTETTGLVRDRNATPFDANMPEIVQLGALLTDDEGNEQGALNTIMLTKDMIDPASKATEIHGVTQEVSQALGVDPRHPLRIMAKWIETSATLICHNIAFDSLILKGAYVRWNYYRQILPTIEQAPQVCTMLTATPIVKIPKPYNATEDDPYKWPKLEECFQHFFGETLIGAHNAMVDVQATKRLYFELKRQGAFEDGTDTNE